MTFTSSPNLGFASLLVILGILPLAQSRAQDEVGEAAVPFVSEKCFSDRTVLLASVDVGGLRRSLPRTPYGRILSHPGFEKALGKLPEFARQAIVQQTSPFKIFFGGDIFQFIDTLSGEWTIALETQPGAPVPNLYVALDMGKERKRILTLFSTYVQLLANTTGVKPDRRKVGDVGVISIATPISGFAFQRAVLGNHLVLALSAPHGLDGIVQRYVAKGESDAGKSLLSSAAFLASREGAVSDPLVSVFFSGSKLLELFEGIPDDPGTSSPDMKATLRAVATALGLDRLDAVRFDLTVSDGDWEESLRLQSSRGFGGLVKVLIDTIGVPRNRDALALVPASASSFGSYSIDQGLFFRELESLALALPEEWQAALIYRGLAHLLEDATGLSVKEQLQKLPRLDVTAFRAQPPAGGLVQDNYAICATGQIVPYLQALDTFARKTGAELVPLDLGERRGVHIRSPSLLRSFGIGPASGPLATLDDDVKMMISSLDPGLSVAFAPITDEWILVADTPQALERYFVVHESAPKVAVDERWAPLVAATEGAAFAVLGGGEDFLVGYNSVVSLLGLLGPTAEPATSMLDLDVAALPPGEEFLPYFRAGFVYAKKSESSVSIRGQRVLTNIVPALVPELLATSAKLLPTAMGIR